jgi:hypothetical protein
MGRASSSSEVLKMILTPRNLEEMTAQLRRIPPEKRRVGVLVGVHLNEANLDIALGLHKHWEKYGAITIQFPPNYTLHKALSDAVKNDSHPDELMHNLSRMPTSYTVANYLLKNGFTMPIVNFHGTPYEQKESHQPGVRYFFGDKGNKTQIVQKPAEPFFETHKTVRATPNMVIAEYMFHGKQTSFSENVRAWFAKHKININYIDNGMSLTHTRENVNDFRDRFASEFLEVIKHLANTGLQEYGRANYD